MNHQDTKTPSTAISSKTDEIAKAVVDAAYTVLKLSGHRLGLLVNFNVPLIKQGIRRMVL